MNLLGVLYIGMGPHAPIPSHSPELFTSAGEGSHLPRADARHGATVKTEKVKFFIHPRDDEVNCKSVTSGNTPKASLIEPVQLFCTVQYEVVSI